MRCRSSCRQRPLWIVWALPKYKLCLLICNQFKTAGVLQRSPEKETLMLCPIMVLTGRDSKTKKRLNLAAADCKHLLQPPAADCSTVALCCKLSKSNPLELMPFTHGYSGPYIDNLCCLLYGCFPDVLVWRHMGLQSLELAQNALGVLCSMSDQLYM